jgi:TonB family protein
VATLESCEFDPLPQYFKGESLTFRINLHSESDQASEPAASEHSISAYKDRVLHQIEANWQRDNLSLLVVIGRSGEVLDTDVCQSSGNRNLDREAEAVVATSDFDPLPDWEAADIIRAHVLSFTADPFDALIVASAQRMELPLITADELITTSKVCPVFWD